MGIQPMKGAELVIFFQVFESLLRPVMEFTEKNNSNYDKDHLLLTDKIITVAKSDSC